MLMTNESDKNYSSPTKTDINRFKFSQDNIPQQQFTHASNVEVPFDDINSEF